MRLMSEAASRHGLQVQHVHLCKEILLAQISLSLLGVDPKYTSKCLGCGDELSPVPSPLGVTLIRRRAPEREPETHDETEDRQQDVTDTD